jgi:hypothetical protein
MSLNYLFEFHFRDGRISVPIAWEWDPMTPLDIGTTVLLEFERVKAWKVADTLPAAGYDAKFVLKEPDE